MFKAVILQVFCLKKNKAEMYSENVRMKKVQIVPFFSVEKSGC